MIEERFDVILTGLEERADRARALGGLQRVLSVDLMGAGGLLKSAPCLLREDLPSGEAEDLLHQLRALGFQVRLKRTALAAARPVATSAAAPEQGAPAPAPDLPLPDFDLPGLDDDAAGPAPAPGATVAAPASVAVEEGEPSFWSTIPSSFALPIRGAGIKWLFWCSGYGAFFALVGFVALVYLLASLAVPLFLGFAAMIVILFGTILLGLVYGYFRATLWAVLADEPEPEPMRELEPTVILESYVKDGLTLVIFLGLQQVVAFIWFLAGLKDGLGLSMLLASPLTWLILFLSSLYWPMGLGLMALRTSRLAFWDVALGYRIMVLAPLEFITLTIMGSLAYIVPFILFVFVAFASGGLALLFAPLLVGLPFAYSHAVQGALMGHLFRTRPELLEGQLGEGPAI